VCREDNKCIPIFLFPTFCLDAKSSKKIKAVEVILEILKGRQHQDCVFREGFEGAMIFLLWPWYEFSLSFVGSKKCNDILKGFVGGFCSIFFTRMTISLESGKKPIPLYLRHPNFYQ
jgi:hypothetical protein